MCHRRHCRLRRLRFTAVRGLWTIVRIDPKAGHKSGFADITHHTRLSEADFRPDEANLKQSHPTYGVFNSRKEGGKYAHPDLIGCPDGGCRRGLLHLRIGFDCRVARSETGELLRAVRRGPVLQGPAGSSDPA